MFSLSTVFISLTPSYKLPHALNSIVMQIFAPTHWGKYMQRNFLSGKKKILGIYNINNVARLYERRDICNLALQRFIKETDGKYKAV